MTAAFICTILSLATPRRHEARGTSCSGLQPRTVAAERAPLRTLIAHERVDRVRLARGVPTARDAAHLVAGKRHAGCRGERLVRPCDGRKLLGGLTAFLPAAAEVGGDRHRARHAD